MAQIAAQSAVRTSDHTAAVTRAVPAAASRRPDSATKRLRPSQVPLYNRLTEAGQSTLDGGLPPGGAPGPVPGPAQSPAAPAPAAPAAPVGGVPGEMRRVNVQPVLFKDSPADPAPTGVSWAQRFLATQDTWSKLGVFFQAAGAVQIVDASLKAAGGTRDERDKVRASWNGTGVGIFMVDNDVADAGGGGTVGGGTANAKIALSDRGASDTLMAHEMGHVLGLGHPPGGADPDTIMEPSGTNNDPNPTRNTIGNYHRITWPAPTGSTIIYPDP
jgi:hypothetical protein